MRRALALADDAARHLDEVPVGSVLVNAQGECIAEGWNQMLSQKDPTAHAEIVALRAGGKASGNYRLVNCCLYVTLEPCTMCAMAIIHARLARVVYAAQDPKTGACGSVFHTLTDSRHNHRVLVCGGVLAEQSRQMLRLFFRSKRGQSMG